MPRPPRRSARRSPEVSPSADVQPYAPLPYASAYHAPVLVEAVVDLLVTDPAGLYIDGTLGGGGHTAALLDRLGSEGRVIGIDQDDDAIRTATERIEARELQARELQSGHPASMGSVTVEGSAAAKADPSAPPLSRFTALRGNFEAMPALLSDAGVATGSVTGILLDLGVSSHQFDVPERGFMFRADGPLDMRMDDRAPQTAADLVNTLDTQALADLLRAYGEEPRAWRIAQEVARRRPITTTGDLAAAVRAAVPTKDEVKSLARVFQALRIAVNDELGVLERALEASLDVLAIGGRLAVLSYHSLEDRRVKQFLKAGRLDGVLERDFYGNALTPWQAVTRKPIEASDAEIAANPRARSARLRVAEFVGHPDPKPPPS
ncbi:MAG: 16S rRNA (cytosine(1402)-N(4))-methyltransferase RsmH [Bacteroidota bacterium]